MDARIYQPSKSTMQSGRARFGHWCLSLDHAAAKKIDPLMGWSGSDDMGAEVSINFPDRDSAVAFAEKHGLTYELRPSHTRRVKPKSYAANFEFKPFD